MWSPGTIRRMRRMGRWTWVLVAAVVVTVVLNIAAPDIGIFAAIALALLIFGVVADGTPAGLAIGNDRTGDEITEGRRTAVGRHFRRGRPKWQETAPDHADEPPDLIWARERERRRDR